MRIGSTGLDVSLHAGALCAVVERTLRAGAQFFYSAMRITATANSSGKRLRNESRTR